jgi:hypothetical protein
MLYLVDGEAWQTLDHFDPEFARTALLFVLVYQWMVSKCTIPSNKCLWTFEVSKMMMSKLEKKISLLVCHSSVLPHQQRYDLSVYAILDLARKFDSRLYNLVTFMQI